jgi:hypothetical protein
MKNIKKYITENWEVKLVSFIIALIIWYLSRK